METFFSLIQSVHFSTGHGKAASGASTRCEVVDWGQHVQQDVFWGTLSVSVLFAVTFEGLLGAREFLENGMESTDHFATHEDGWWRRWNPQHLYQPHFSQSHNKHSKVFVKHSWKIMELGRLRAASIAWCTKCWRSAASHQIAGLSKPR